MLTRSFVPDDFRFGVIVPLLKHKHGDASRLDMYRGITLSSTISKLFEYVLALKNYISPGSLAALSLLYPPSERSERGIYCDACCRSVVLSFCPSVRTQYLDANISKTV